jgi:hypothetical protein
MSDFTLIKTQVNTGPSDASPTWTDMLLGTANYELRLCGVGAGAGNISSTFWPTFLQNGYIGVFPEMWGYFGSDNSGGLKVTTYDGTAAHYMQWRINWDSTGTFVSAPILSAWKDNTLPAAIPGQQSGTGDGSAFVNGHILDTNNTSYIKANAYGSGVTAAGAQETPAANAGGILSSTSGVAGAAITPAGAWLANWQGLQASTSWIQAGAIPHATTAGFWYMALSFYHGPGMNLGLLIPNLGVQYIWT